MPGRTRRRLTGAMTTTKTLSIQIPDGANPGDTLSFSVDGHILEMEIPLGSKSGDVLQIQVGGGNDDEDMDVDDNDDDNNDNVERQNASERMVESSPSSTTATRIQLSSGATIHRSSQLPANEHIRGTPGSDDGTHAMAWPAGRTLVKYIDSPAFIRLLEDMVESNPGKNSGNIRCVLELGSGLGLVGLALAHSLTRSQNFQSDGMPVQVVLTDVTSAIPLLNYNIQQNQHLLGTSRRVNVTAVPLMWHTLPISSSTTTIDWLIGSDLLYNHQNIPSLVATIKRLLFSSTSSRRSRIILSVRWRKPDLERAFFEQMNQYVDWKLVETSLCSCKLSWEDYGNPNCDASNVYFSSTMIGVDGVPKSLGSIDEADTQRMTTEEYDAYERMQIQIYIGIPKHQQQDGGNCGVKRRAI